MGEKRKRATRIEVRACSHGEKTTFMLENAELLSASLLPRSDMRKLVDALGTYLKEKRTDDWGYLCDIYAINKRAAFVKSCLNAVDIRDQSALEELLAEKRIGAFKGIWTQRLYDIAKSFQFFSAKRKAEIAKGAPALLSPLIEVVGEYDAGMHCDIDPDVTPEAEEKEAPASSPTLYSSCVIASVVRE